MPDDERKLDWMNQLLTHADHLNSIDTPDPGATAKYEIMSGALMWPDEIRPDTPTEVIWALRFLWAHRTRLMLKTADPGWDVWEKCLSAFPRWIGFRPERRNPTDELLAEYHRGDNALDQWIEAMEVKRRNEQATTGIWSPHAEQLVRRLIAELPPEQLDPACSHAVRLNALPIGMDLGSDYYLLPNGSVVIVGEDLDHPNRDTIYGHRVKLLFSLTWGIETYPELRQLLPKRMPGAADCLSCRRPGVSADRKRICLSCGGVGWFPPTFASD